MNEIWRRRNKQFQLNKKINYPPIISRIKEMVLNRNKLTITNQMSSTAKINNFHKTWQKLNFNITGTQTKIKFTCMKIKEPLHNTEKIFKYWFLIKLDNLIPNLSGKNNLRIIRLKFQKLIKNVKDDWAKLLKWETLTMPLNSCCLRQLNTIKWDQLLYIMSILESIMKEISTLFCPKLSFSQI